MVLPKQKIHSHLLQWLKFLQTTSSFSVPKIDLSSNLWYTLYQTYYPRRDSKYHITTIRQFTYYMSSVYYDQIIVGFKKKIMRKPSYELRYELLCHNSTQLNEDRSVEILKNSGGNDLAETCRGKNSVDDVKNFVSLIDQKDQVNVDSSDDSNSDTESEDDETVEDEGCIGWSNAEQSAEDDDTASYVEAEECDPDHVVSGAVNEVMIERHHSAGFVEGGLIFTANKTVQICTSSLSCPSSGSNNGDEDFE